MAKSGDFVLPGFELGFSEEYIPGEGTHEEDGTVYASTTGIMKIDMNERKISVLPRTSVPTVPKEGDIIIGKIFDVKQQVAIVDILKTKGVERGLPGNLSGSIHISNVRNSYVEELSRELSPGDVIYARVLNANRSPIQLTMVGKELGVIKAFCYRCNKPLVLDGRKLKCRECGRVEFRRLAKDYGKGLV